MNALDVQTFLKMEKPSLRDNGFCIVVIIVVREPMSLPPYSQGSLQVLKSSANMSPIRETEGRDNCWALAVAQTPNSMLEASSV